MKPAGATTVGFFYLCVLSGAASVTAQEASFPRPTGSIEILSGPIECEDQTCYEVSVTCPEVAAPARANLKIASSRGSENSGTIIFATGGPGTFLYEDSGAQGMNILAGARSSGFQTVQVQWIDSWLFSSKGEEAGHVRLACRPATVARWVHEHLATPDPDQAFCATGHSGGAAQVSYMLSHYGLEEILDSVVPTGGPPMARMDLSCDRNDAANAHVVFPDWAAIIIDAGLGFMPEGDPNDLTTFRREGSGPCARGDQSFLETLRQGSVASGDGDYVYPNTMVSFVFEGVDDTHAVAQGTQYHDLLVSEGSPLVSTTVVPDVAHGGVDGVVPALYDTEAGASQIQDSLLAACRVWE